MSQKILKGFRALESVLKSVCQLCDKDWRQKINHKDIADLKEIEDDSAISSVAKSIVNFIVEPIKISSKSKQREADDAAFRLKHITIKNEDDLKASTASLKVTNKLSEVKGKREKSQSKH